MSEISCSPPCQNMVPHPWQVGDVVFMCLQNYWALALRSPESTQPCPLSLQCGNATDRAVSGGGMAVSGLPPGSCRQGSCKNHGGLTVSPRETAMRVVLRWKEGCGGGSFCWTFSPPPPKKKDHIKLQPLDLFQRKSTPLWWPWNYLTPPPLWESPDL